METTLSKYVSSPVQKSYFVDEEVLWWRDRPVGSLTEFFIITGVVASLSHLDNSDRQIMVSLDQVKAFYEREPTPMLDVGLATKYAQNSQLNNNEVNSKLNDKELAK